MKIRIIKDSAEFFDLKDAWNNLLASSGSDTVFLTWEWAYNWWIHFRTDKRLFVVVAEESGVLIGVAPCYLINVVFFGIRRLTHLEFLGTTHTASEYLDFIVAKDRETEIIENILDAIFRSKESWDVLNLVGISEGSRNLQLCMDYFNRKEIKNNIYEIRNLPYIPFPDSLTAFLKTLSKDKQNRFLRYRRNLSKDYAVSFETVGNINELGKTFDEFISIYLKRWQKKGEDGSFTEGKRNYLDFHRSITKTFFAKDWLYFATLRVNNEIVAAQYDFLYKNKLYYYSVTFDPRWAKYRVGSILLLQVLEDGIRKKFQEVDLLRGEETYKFHWTKQTRRTFDIAVWRSRRTLFVTEGERSLRKIIKQMMPKKLAESVFNAFFSRK